MKKIFFLISFVAALMLSLTSCHEDEYIVPGVPEFAVVSITDNGAIKIGRYVRDRTMPVPVSYVIVASTDDRSSITLKCLNYEQLVLPVNEQNSQNIQTDYSLKVTDLNTITINLDAVSQENDFYFSVIGKNSNGLSRSAIFQVIRAKNVADIEMQGSYPLPVI